MSDPARLLPPRLAADIDAWTTSDPDPNTRAALRGLRAAAESGDPRALTELRDAFAERLQFGTAGLRGALGPGPNRMNRVVVGQAAAGLAAYLADSGHTGRVLIGYDARHCSDTFALDTAEILAGAGFEALLAGAPLPTPVVAFGVRFLDCVAAVVVTASHNPARDNGYKVYLGDGSQIVPPADAAIARRIDEAARRPLADLPRSEGYQQLGPELTEAYLNRLGELVPAGAPRQVRWVYTPLHGVGGRIVAEAVARTRFPPAAVVAEQAVPDPDFPTVPFPNPEEPGALDLAIELATRTGADLVIANDPDADRCAVAVPVSGTWRALSGDELGAVLADDALRRGVQGTYACSIVSSSLLSAMASAAGQPFVSTLTGFKWIGRVPGLAFGYEEAIGYCVDPPAVRDKDGISALLRVLALAAELRAEGLTLLDRLDELERRFGVHRTEQLAVRVQHLAEIATAMARLRSSPPAVLAGEPVTFEDLAPGSAELPPTEGVRFLGATVSVVVRPSGTEPKLKCYLEARLDPAASSPLDSARAVASRRLAQLRSEISTALGW